MSRSGYLNLIEFNIIIFSSQSIFEKDTNPERFHTTWALFVNRHSVWEIYYLKQILKEKQQSKITSSSVPWIT